MHFIAHGCIQSFSVFQCYHYFCNELSIYFIEVIYDGFIFTCGAGTGC
nr:MAG TPA: hypothetical protein [Bacteriophage sp.]